VKQWTHDAEREELLERMGTLAREAFPDTAKAAAATASKRQFKAAMATARGPRSRFWLAAPVAAVLAVVAVLVLRNLPERLAYEVESPSPSTGGYLQGTKQSPAVARFTDGTEVRVNEGARARIVDVESHGARVALEQGRARLRVVHRPAARWSVDAGPFSIAVTGTEFDVDWSAADGVLVVELRAGGVIVKGPLAVDGIGVHAGQRLVASIPESKLHIEPIGAASPVAAAPPTATEVPAESSVRARPATLARTEVDGARATRNSLSTDAVHSEPPAAATPATWSKRVASGDFRGVIADAESRGLSATLSQAPLSDLVALADAARYTGNSGIARDALASQRKRYPTSTDAKGAAFLLGRLADERGATGEAIGWYERYLAEAPRGAFAAEALGRQMLATKRARGAAAAAVLARRYLDQFPGGPHAAPARELARTP
jgi:ferric-dicitrate binding protein FerR (iron transport regulator)/TolA-binding protein